MKKNIRIVTVLMLALCMMLTACGGGAPATPAAPAASQAPAAPAAPAASQAPAAPAAPAAQAPTETYEFTMGTPFDQKSPQAIAGQKFCDEVKEATNGAVTINFFTNGAIGNEKDQFLAVAADELDFTVGGVLPIDMYAPEYGFITAPYLYKDTQHLKSIMDSSIGDGMRDKFRQNNLNMLAFVMKGARNTSSNRAIRTPDDVKGLKIRMTELPTWIAVWGDQGLGGVTVPIALGELYQALQTGVVEASEGPYEQLATNKFYEVQKYLINTNHVQDWSALFMSDALLESLPEDIANIIREKAKSCITDYGDQLCAEMAEGFHKQLLDGGMEEIEVDTNVFRERVMSVYDKFFAEVWKGSTFDEIQSYAK